MAETPPHPRALTIGVEIEFSLAHRIKKPPFKSMETDEEGRPLFFTDNIHRHIAKTLTDAGYPADVGQDKKYREWQVDGDVTIKPPRPRGEYEWAGIEVRSPVLWFCEESLNEVRNVCYLLESRYHTIPTDSCGLHVHVGNGKEQGGSFDFSTLRNLYALLWAFEPQLDTLHPPHRQDGRWMQSLRGMTRKDEEGETLRPLEGVLACLEAEDTDDLAEINGVADERGQAYNFQPALLWLQGEKSTVEFRQHEGTLDGEAVTMWIRTVVGLVEYARDAVLRPAEFTDLLMIARYEEIGDKSNPLLCEEGFTVIDLLKLLGLFRSALFYKKRGLHGPYRPEWYWPRPVENAEA